MSDKHTLQAKIRDLAVKNKVYRQSGYILANIYGVDESQPVVVPDKPALKLLPEVSESTVIYLDVEGKKEIPVMLSEVQRDAVTGQVLHLALRQVNLKEKVVATIPIETAGSFDIPEAVYLLVKDEIEAEALPTDLPEKFVVDVSKFTKIGDQFTLAELDYDRTKVTLHVEDENEPIVVVNAVKVEVEEPPATAPAEGEATTATSGEAAPAAAGSTPEASKSESAKK